MKALVKQKAEPGLWMKDTPIPTIQPDEVLIRIHKTAICGTDMHIWSWDHWAQMTIPVPMTIGHEYIGTIAEVGSHVHHLQVGQRVSGEGHIVCGQCRSCREGQWHLCPHTMGVGVNRPGAFAEYLALPAFNVFPIPDHISDDLGAIFDPFGNATHTALNFNPTGETVLITGAGPIGIMAACIVQQSGAAKVILTDVNDYRLGLAHTLGVHHTINVGKTDLHHIKQKLRIEEGFTLGLEMSGQPIAFRQLLEQISHGGNIALLGLFAEQTAIDWSSVILKSITLKGIYGRQIFRTWHQMIALIESGLDLSPLITHHFPASEFEHAFSTMASGQSGKVILDWRNL